MSFQSCGDQNGEEAQLLLRAASAAYRRASRIRRLRLFGSVLPAALAPGLLFWQPNTEPYLAIVASVWVVAAHAVLRRSERSALVLGASLQEEFDCHVLGVPWNGELVGQRVAPETVFKLANTYPSQPRLRNWYPEVDATDAARRCLIRQRSNLAWDHSLRHEYAVLAGIVGTFLFLVYAAWSYALGHTLEKYALGLLIPSLPALLHASDILVDQREASKTGQERLHLANELLARLDTAPKSVTSGDCRQIQDGIYAGRSSTPAISGWWYRLRRRRYEEAMNYAAGTFDK